MAISSISAGAATQVRPVVVSSPKPTSVPAPTDADGDHDGDTAAAAEARGGIDVKG